MHGKLKYDGKRLAGLYPHDQVKLVEKAGASIFGAVVNTNCNKTFPWNIARVCTFIKACTAVANIPVHANVGMGVCGVPMVENMPSDMISRADKACDMILMGVCCYNVFKNAVRTVFIDVIFNSCGTVATRTRVNQNFGR